MITTQCVIATVGKYIRGYATDMFDCNGEYKKLVWFPKTFSPNDIYNFFDTSCMKYTYLLEFRIDPSMHDRINVNIKWDHMSLQFLQDVVYPFLDNHHDIGVFVYYTLQYNGVDVIECTVGFSNIKYSSNFLLPWKDVRQMAVKDIIHEYYGLQTMVGANSYETHIVDCGGEFNIHKIIEWI